MDEEHEKSVEHEISDRGTLAGMASAVVDAAAPVISAMGTLAAGARRILDERPGARVRRVRRMGRQPLANLWDLHPEAYRATPRDFGFHAVAVESIAGTAVEGAPQRGGDFLPLKDRRSEDWKSRWQRIRAAIDALANLPPIELVKYDDSYWVLDGHNRVAAALYNGQPEIDAVVRELRRPGHAPRGPTPLIAGVVEDSIDLRNAGTGRRTRTTKRETDLVSKPHKHAHDRPDDGEAR
ncbi:MAG TPA: hypothetical protein VMZ66_09560 [Aeromicrobium sp.]|nr:hypothetical protein [Aeromicrobium sp.]